MIQLDDSQLEFCKNIRLLAPAGCGKTLSLLYRCSKLLKRSEGHPRFLIVTFTKAAAAELQERLTRDPQFRSVSDHARITTLNAYGWQRIRDQVRSPNLLANQTDYHFAMLRQLRGDRSGYRHMRSDQALPVEQAGSFPPEPIPKPDTASESHGGSRSGRGVRRTPA